MLLHEDGRIENVEMLKDGSDEDLIRQATLLFQEHVAVTPYDGFEVWSGKRFVYRSALADLDKGQ